MYKRFIVPFYIPILILSSLCLIIKSKENINFTKYRLFIFLIGFGFIIFSETTLKYIQNTFYLNLKIFILPIIFLITIYLTVYYLTQKNLKFQKIMKTYIKFLIQTFLKSFFYVFLIILSLVFILNILSEIEFFREIEIEPLFPLYLSILNSPSLIFEMFPFIFLISSQLFFINLFNDNQLQIFKYSGLKNSIIVRTISLLSFAVGLIIIFIFYNFSSNFKNFYLELKSKYSSDDKYLAVITKNGLWIKDKINGQINIVNASKIDNEFLIDTFITQFNEKYEVIKNIYSENINIKERNWIAYNAKYLKIIASTERDQFELKSNFDYQKIQSLFSNLSSLSILELIDLKRNYEKLNYSTTEVDLQIHKIISYPFYLTLMTILSSIIMFNTRNFKSSTFKISVGMFTSVIIYYVNNFFNVMGKTEKISLIPSIWIPLMLLIFINSIFLLKINDK